MWIRLEEQELALIKAALSVLTIPAAKELVQKIEGKQNPTEDERLQNEQYLEAANNHHHVDGETEFDEDSIVSAGDDPGAYVMAWVWVTDEEAGFRLIDTPIE